MPQGIIRQSEQYGLDEPADSSQQPLDPSPSPTAQMMSQAMRSGPRIHRGTMDRRQEAEDFDL